jgi:uncharacterized protein YkwD
MQRLCPHRAAVAATAGAVALAASPALIAPGDAGARPVAPQASAPQPMARATSREAARAPTPGASVHGCSAMLALWNGPARRTGSGRGTLCRMSRFNRPHRRAAEAPSPDQLSPASAIRRARASMIALVLSTPCQNTELLPTAEDLEEVRGAVLCLIDRQRADHSEMPLQENSELQAAAEGHSAEMVTLDYFEHVSPSGLTPVNRVDRAGYIPDADDGYVIGENIAWGTLSLSTPAAIVAAWMASPAHRANILEGEYRDTGVGISPQAPSAFAEGAQGATYTQEFGVIIPPTIGAAAH